jgi:hypothetical protein
MGIWPFIVIIKELKPMCLMPGKREKYHMSI